MENHLIVVLDGNYLRVSGDLSAVVRDVGSLYTHYQQVLVEHESEGKNFDRFKKHILNQIQNIRHTLNRATGLLNSGIVVGEDVALKTLMSHLSYHVGYGSDLVNHMEAHLTALVEPEPKPLPERVLTIEQILDIFDGKHPLYVLIKNRIRDVQPRSMCHEYLQRLHFKSKYNNEGERLYVDYVTSCLLNDSDSDEREYLMEQIQDGEFDDVTYNIKNKKKKA